MTDAGAGTRVDAFFTPATAAAQTGDGIAAEASNALSSAMHRFFHPIFGGTDGEGWPFGGTIRYADLYRAALVPGIQRLTDVEIVRDNQPFGNCADVTIDPGALVELIDVSVTITEDVEEEALA